MSGAVGAADKTASAQLILQLYDLRRETRMRQAREWFVTFVPVSADEVIAAWRGEATSASYRMVVSFWDMASALVNHGAIDAAMFHASGNEHALVFARLEPFLEALRRSSGIPDYLVQLERCVQSMPEGRMAWTRNRAETQRAARREQVPGT